MEITNNYAILDNVTIYFNGESELRIRKGIWNFEEATLDLSFLNESTQKAMAEVMSQLSKEQPIDMKSIYKKYVLAQDEYNNILSILDTLVEQNYLKNNSDEDVNSLLREIIGGTVADRFSEGYGRFKPVLFIADTENMKKHAVELAKQMDLPLTVLNQNDINEITKANLTDKLEAIETNSAKNELLKLVEPFCCVIVSLERPHIKLLRNLNRLLLELSKPLVLSMMDGPFMSLMTIKAPETGCIECFENRVLARMEEMTVYSKFVEQTGGVMATREKTYMTPLLQTMTSAAIFEGVLISSIGKAKLAGRIINIYLPLLEIQVQELLRVPFCPACGHIAKAQFDEMYTSSKMIVDKLVSKIILKKQ